LPIWEFALVFGDSKRQLILTAIFILTNIFLFGIAASSVFTLFQSFVLGILLLGLDFIMVFIVVARYLVRSMTREFWLKWSVLILSIYSAYTILAIAVGVPLLSIMGLGIGTFPSNSPLTIPEFKILSLYTYGISSIASGLIALSLAYFLQKYLVRQLYRVYRMTTNYYNFIETNAPARKSRTLNYALWLALLPFPIQQILSPSAGVTIVGAAYYLPAALAVFVLWGLAGSHLVGIKEGRIFKLYNAVHSGLFWFVIIQWFSIVVYSFSTTANITTNAVNFSESVTRFGILLARSLYAFGPSAIITAYFYKNALEDRANTNVLDHLRKREKLDRKELKIIAE
jgi:hypothetical protein